MYTLFIFGKKVSDYQDDTHFNVSDRFQKIIAVIFKIVIRVSNINLVVHIKFLAEKKDLWCMNNRVNSEEYISV